MQKLDVDPSLDRKKVSLLAVNKDGETLLSPDFVRTESNQSPVDDRNYVSHFRRWPRRKQLETNW